MKTLNLLAYTALGTVLSFGAAHAATDNVKEGISRTQVMSPSSKPMKEVTDGKVSAKTENFVKKVSVASEFEIATSKLALDRSKDANVREFAKRMITDHEQLAENLKASMPSDINYELAQGVLDEKHQQLYQKLKDTPAPKFNSAYIHAQRNAHKDAVNLFSNYSRTGDEEDLREFASDSLPNLRKHQSHVNAIEPSKAAIDSPLM